jgi:hypothetical protein
MVKNMKIEMTEKEKEQVIRELGERIKDLIYMNLHKKVSQALDEILAMDLKPEEPLTITFSYGFVVNDIIQMLGRIRRMKNEEEWKQGRIKKAGEIHWG